MSFAARLLYPYLRAYAGHAELPFTDAALRLELERRLALLPRWVGGVAAFGALWIRWLAPLLLCRRLRRFESLNATDKERLLARLERAHMLPARAVLLSVKSVVAPVCYGGLALADQPPVAEPS